MSARQTTERFTHHQAFQSWCLKGWPLGRKKDFRDRTTEVLHSHWPRIHPIRRKKGYQNGFLLYTVDNINLRGKGSGPMYIRMCLQLHIIHNDSHVTVLCYISERRHVSLYCILFSCPSQILCVCVCVCVFLPGYVALWDSKTPHGPTCEWVSCCLETSSSQLLPP